MATKKKVKESTSRKREAPARPPIAAAPVALTTQVDQPVVAAPVKKMKPIWYMVGLVLLSIGGVIFLSGVYYVFYPAPARVVGAHLYPNLWWGGIMVAAGAVFILTNRKKTVE